MFIETCEDSLISSLRYIKWLAPIPAPLQGKMDECVERFGSQGHYAIGSIGESERWLRWRMRAPHGYYAVER